MINTRLLFIIVLTLLIVGLLMVGYARAEVQVLYLNRDNRVWVAEKTFVNEDDCDRAARRAIREGQALGAGCARYVPDQAPQWNGQPYDGTVTKDEALRQERQQRWDLRRDNYEKGFYRTPPSMGVPR